MSGCDVCGFDFDAMTIAEVPDRATNGTSAIAALLGDDPIRAAARPSSERWSAVEYAAHVRDVLLSIRDRVVIGLVEDTPTFSPLYREERVDLGLYRNDPPEAVAVEVEAAGAMLLRLLAEIESVPLQRSVHYGYPNPSLRTLEWMAKQAVHEIEHHLDDMRENLA